MTCEVMLCEKSALPAEPLSYRANIPIMDLLVDGKYDLVMSDGPLWREQRRFALHVLRDFGFGEKFLRILLNAPLLKVTT